MTENEKRGPGRPPKKRTNDDESDDRRDIEEILGELESNAKVKVHRMDPEWASGYLGQFYISQGKKLTTEEIKNRFGGRVLQLVIHGPNGKYVKRQTVVIDDVPRREGKPVLRDGTTDIGDSKKEKHPLETMMGWGLPPALSKQISNFYLGAGADENHAPQNQSYTDMAGAMGLQKIMMDMMAQSNQANMNMMQFQFEMQKNMMSARQDFENNAKPKDPLGDVTSMIKVFRELNGMKAEFGPPDETMAGKILENTMPMVETLLSEYMAYMKMKAQAEMQRSVALPPAAPALPQRQAPPPSPKVVEGPQSTGAPSNAPQKKPPTAGEMARQMAQMYNGLSFEEKQEVNLAFIQALNGDEETQPENEAIENKMDHGENYDNMEQIPIESEYLDSQDLELLQHGGSDKDQNATGYVQDGQHTGATEENDPPDR